MGRGWLYYNKILAREACMYSESGENAAIAQARELQVARLENPLESAISTISVFGSRMLGITEDGSHLLVWDMESKGMPNSTYCWDILRAENLDCLELANSIEFGASFTATHVLHPATYLNKVVVASSQGGLQLWNISTGWVT